MLDFSKSVFAASVDVPEKVGLDHTESLLNSIGIAVFGATLSFMVAWFWYIKTRTESKAAAAIKTAEDKAAAIAVEHAAVVQRLTELETKERMSGQMMTPIITAFQSLLIKQLTHDEKPEMDALMVKVGPPDVLNDTERDRLMVMLQQRAEDMGLEISHSERDAAMILPIVMQMAAKEQANFKSIRATQDLKLITIVSVVAAHPASEPSLDPTTDPLTGEITDKKAAALARAGHVVGITVEESREPSSEKQPDGLGNPDDHSGTPEK